jgi:hypothetical protein
MGKIWDEQIELLSAHERVANVAETCWFVMTYCKIHGERLFERVYNRTSSLDSDGERLCVGLFGGHGNLFVDSYWDDRRDSVGLSIAMK